jgi:tetratricopeptide (TPR) repeat protein
MLADTYSQGSVSFTHGCSLQTTVTDRLIALGFSLGGFLTDAGWLFEAEKVLLTCLKLCQTSDVQYLLQGLECCIRLMHVRNANCLYEDAQKMWTESLQYVNRLEQRGVHINKASLYAEYSTLLFARSQYEEAFRYCCLSLQQVNDTLPPRAVLDVFRQAAKVCVVRREFKKAELLIQFAVQYARDHFGTKHQKYSDALLDYGFFLLNIDSICQSVKVYQTALDIRIAVFGGNNLHVAIAHEDLAYCAYVHEYSSGKFQDAKNHAEMAIDIITHILPQDHLLLASSKRVKALILEEIAIDSHHAETESRLLDEAQELHLSSLMLAMRAFGENNVQTAKHYGNLGRLYQSMHKFAEAEEMHLKAIAIKERLLGIDDYEVALSVGHLASLYNYDMNKFDEAEQLYLRSIAIGRKLFGEGYSGLEYDYRGLLRLYHAKGNAQKAAEYSTILHDWNLLRDRIHVEFDVPLQFTMDSSNCEQVIRQFFSIPERADVIAANTVAV